jgi:hypothetical protein
MRQVAVFVGRVECAEGSDSYFIIYRSNLFMFLETIGPGLLELIGKALEDTMEGTSHRLGFLFILELITGELHAQTTVHRFSPVLPPHMS